MSSFWKAFVATAIPLSAIGIVSFFANLPGPLVGVMLVCYPVALAVAIVLGVRRQPRAAAGVFVGLAASILVLITSCFAASATGRMG
jgi:hypothetical protein